jgi:prostaglandin-E synthase
VFFFSRFRSHLNPELLWAQRENEVYLTINVPDVTNPKIDLTEQTLFFAGDSAGKKYEVQLEFYESIDPEVFPLAFIGQQSKKAVTPRQIVLILAKKEQGKSWWPRLLKNSKKPHFLKTDFARWKDEDEEEESTGMDMPFNMDFSQFGGLVSEKMFIHIVGWNAWIGR